jgi:antitoxin ParD1/3/4
MSITLPTEMARLVKSKVASGSYASESEVIREGLRALQERDEAVERWLRTEVVATYDAHKANPTLAQPLDEAMKEFDAFMDETERNGA